MGEEKGGGGGSRAARPDPRTRTFTFATLPQFSDLTTPPPVRKDGSHFTVYITLIDQ